MGMNNSIKANVDFRRQHVASMRLRGMTQREIQTALTGMGIINPRTDKEYSIGIINADVKALRKHWQKEAQGDTEEHVGQMLAELAEVKRMGWSLQDLRAILQALKQEADLRGLNASQGIDLTTGGQPLQFTTVEVVKDYGPDGKPVGD